VPVNYRYRTAGRHPGSRPAFQPQPRLRLERYYLGMVKGEAELASLEEHLPACPACVERAESTQD